MSDKKNTDPAMGTGGMLSVAQEYLQELNPDARLEVFGQDYNEQSYAISGSDMMIKGQNIDHIVFGDSFTADGFPDKKFDYSLQNPPFGVEWKPEQKYIEKEAEEKGFAGRFGAGLPRINDGSFLFLQHVISKMKKPEDGGSRLGIVLNGSPLFTGGAGSGESEIRRWIIENDWLETIIALPDQLFYNTGISTYIWILTNRKEQKRKGKVQLIDASSYFVKMRKSLGNKRNEISDEHRHEIVQIYGDFKEGENCKIFPNTYFGYNRITVERPLRLNFCVNAERLERVKQASQFIGLAESLKRKDTSGAREEIEKGQQLQISILEALKSIESEGVVRSEKSFTSLLDRTFTMAGLKLKTPVYRAIKDALSERDETAEIVTDASGNSLPDPDLRDFDNVPLNEKIDSYMKREVLPFVPDAWVDAEKTKVGYEISFNRYFYVYKAPRSVEEIQADLTKIEDEISALLGNGSEK